jgi:CRP/FNR family cyclic AMP-dependent transcriptional regulator
MRVQNLLGPGIDPMTVDISVLRDELDRVATPTAIPSGTLLFRCGDPVSGIFIIRSGAVNMFLDSGAHTHLAKTLGPGEIAGLPAALTGVYSLSAQVAEDANLGFIPAAVVSALLERSPHLCLVAARAMSDEIARTRSGLRETLPIH